jgi:hypothetical protein
LLRIVLSLLLSFGWLFAQRVEGVKIEGALYVPEDVIRGLIKVKEGMSYDPLRCGRI